MQGRFFQDKENTRVKQTSLNELNVGIMLRYCRTSSKQVIITNTDIQTGLLLLPSVLKGLKDM